MNNFRYLQNNDQFEIQYAMFMNGEYVFPKVPEGYIVVDSKEAKEWHQYRIDNMYNFEAAYYAKNNTNFD